MTDSPPWPEYPTDENPYFGDGETYGSELGRISPEGNIYGQTRRIREVEHAYWWDGEEWVRIDDVAGYSEDIDDLPEGPMDFGSIWAVWEYSVQHEESRWTHYYWDQEWKALSWYNTVNHTSDLPHPGFHVGAAHKVVERNVLVMWDGFKWIRGIAHKSLLNDQPELHLPEGFIELLTPSAKVTYVSPNEITLRRAGASGEVVVAGQKILAGQACSAFTTVPTLQRDEAGTGLEEADIEADTEYWLYLANNTDAFNRDSWDYRGRLFVSSSEPQNGYLSLSGTGANAKLAGRIQTDSEGLFLRELDISLLDRSGSLPEAFRDYSDFVLEFVDQDTLKLAKIDGTYGQIYVPEELRYLGEDYLIGRDDAWVSLSESNRPVRNETSLLPNTTYYVYISNDLDAFNFNDVNINTNRPWQIDDEGAATYYVADKDLRLRPFISPVVPDSGRLTESWPGFYTRHVGTIKTDANGLFVPLTNMSVVRPVILDPAYFDGLAEIRLEIGSTTQMKLCKIRGSSGIILVAGEAITTYEPTDERCHVLNNSDTVWGYDEDEIDDPLVTTGHTVSYYASSGLEVYLANSEECWGNLAGKLFASTVAPTDGYLSRNWPGVNARWVAKLVPDSRGEFTGSCINEGIGEITLFIDDAVSSLSKLWSSQKIANEIASLWVVVDASRTYLLEKSYGLSIIVEMVNTTTIGLRAITPTTTIVFPDLSSREIDSDGFTLSLAGNAAGYYRIYLSEDSIFLSKEVPTNSYARLEERENAFVVAEIYLTSFGAITGGWNLWSTYNEPIRQWTTAAAQTVTGWQNVVVGKAGGILEGTRTGGSYHTVTATGMVQWYYSSKNLVHSGKIITTGTAMAVSGANYATAETRVALPTQSNPNPPETLCATHTGLLTVTLLNPGVVAQGVYSGTWMSHSLAAATCDYHVSGYPLYTHYYYEGGVLKYAGSPTHALGTITGDVVLTRRPIE